MASGEFGGGGGVKFQIDVQALKSQNCSSNGQVHHHDLEDDTDENQAFTIEIKLPARSTDLTDFKTAFTAISSGLPSAAAGTRIQLSLPIEKNTVSRGTFPQIRVTWPSKI
jgi:hypothetical protein